MPTQAVGNDAAITMPNAHGGNIRTWSADSQIVLSEVTGFGSSSREYKGGIAGLTGSAAGNPEFGAANTAPGTDDNARVDGASITLTVATGCTLGFTAIMQNIRFNVDKVGDSQITFDFTANGDITETWAVS